MPTFSIRSPDGRTFTVNAPSGATPAEVLARVQAHAKSTPVQKDSFGAGVAGHFLDGVVPGLARFNNGVGSAILNAVKAPFSSTEDFHPVKSFQDGQAVMDRALPAFAKAHPNVSANAEVAGMAGGMALPVTKLASGATMGARIAAGAKTAGAYGALSGAMSTKAHDLQDALSDTFSSGAMSSMLGGALPVAGRVVKTLAAPLAPLVQPVVRKAGEVLEHLPGRAGEWGSHLAADPARAQALQEVNHEVRQFVNPATGQNYTPQEVAAEVSRRHQMGVPAAPADIHESARRSYGAAARTPGPATAAVRRAIDARQQKATERVSSHVADTLGPTANVEAQADGLKQYAREVSKPLYDISNDQPIPNVKELQQLFKTPSGSEALQQAGRELLDRQEPLTAYGLVQDRNGTFGLGKAPTMQGYDLAKQKLDEGIYGGENPFASDNAKSFGKGARDIRAQLLRIMDGDGSGPRIAPEPAPGPAGLPGAPPGPETLLPGANLPVPSNGPPAGPQGLPAASGLPQLPAPGQMDLPAIQGQASGLPVPPPGPLPAPQGAPAFDPGQRLTPEAPVAPAAPRQPGPGSAIPDNGLNPYWKAAREAYGGPIQAKKALEMGQDLAGGDAEEAANRMARMTGIQQDFFRLGHRSGIAKDVKSVGDWGNAARSVAGNLAKREALATVHGPDRAAALLDRTNAEHEAHQTFAAVRGNSQTTDRAAEMAAQDAKIEAATGGVLQALAGSPGMGTWTALKALGSGDRLGAVKGHIAEILGDTNPESVMKNMSEAERTAAAKARAKHLRDLATLRASKLFGSVLGTNMIEPIDNQ